MYICTTPSPLYRHVYMPECALIYSFAWGALLTGSHIAPRTSFPAATLPKSGRLPVLRIAGASAGGGLAATWLLFLAGRPTADCARPTTTSAADGCARAHVSGRELRMPRKQTAAPAWRCASGCRLPGGIVVRCVACLRHSPTSLVAAGCPRKKLVNGNPCRTAKCPAYPEAQCE